jgi:hypothetical protein
MYNREFDLPLSLHFQNIFFFYLKSSKIYVRDSCTGHEVFRFFSKALSEIFSFFGHSDMTCKAAKMRTFKANTEIWILFATDQRANYATRACASRLFTRGRSQIHFPSSETFTTDLNIQVWKRTYRVTTVTDNYISVLYIININ